MHLNLKKNKIEMHCPHTFGHVMYKRVNFTETNFSSRATLKHGLPATGQNLLKPKDKFFLSEPGSPPPHFSAVQCFYGLLLQRGYKNLCSSFCVRVVKGENMMRCTDLLESFISFDIGFARWKQY